MAGKRSVDSLGAEAAETSGREISRCHFLKVPGVYMIAGYCHVTF